MGVSLAAGKECSPRGRGPVGTRSYPRSYSGFSDLRTCCQISVQDHLLICCNLSSHHMCAVCEIREINKSYRISLRSCGEENPDMTGTKKGPRDYQTIMSTRATNWKMPSCGAAGKAIETWPWHLGCASLGSDIKNGRVGRGSREYVM